MNPFRTGAVCAHQALSFLACLPLAASLSVAPPAAAQAASSDKAPVSVFVYDRTRIDNWEWFAAPPTSNNYTYVQTLQRIGMTQQLHRWDWELELAQPAIFDVPDNAVAPVSAQGQLGLGGTYYAANNNTDPAAAYHRRKHQHTPGSSGFAAPEWCSPLAKRPRAAPAQ